MVTELMSGACRSCFLETRDVIIIPRLSLTVCGICLRYRDGTNWRGGEGELESVLGEAAMNLIARKARFAEEVRHMGPSIGGIDIDRIRVSKESVMVEAIATVVGLGEPLQVRLTPRISLKRVTCRTCQLKDSEYYACLLQVRAAGRVPDAVELDSAEGIVRDRTTESDRNSMDYISRIIDRKEGRDIYLGSAALGRAAAKEILRERGGTLGETRKLVGVEKGSGKRQYRFTILVRLPELRVGDITELRGTYYAVLHQSGSRTTLLDLEGQTLTFEGARGEELPLVSRREEVGKALVTEVRPDGIQILDPRSSETFEAGPLPWETRAGNTIRVFWSDGVPRPCPFVEQEASS